jgi:hypothetical protein
VQERLRWLESTLARAEEANGRSAATAATGAASVASQGTDASSQSSGGKMAQPIPDAKRPLRVTSTGKECRCNLSSHCFAFDCLLSILCAVDALLSTVHHSPAGHCCKRHPGPALLCVCLSRVVASSDVHVARSSPVGVSSAASAPLASPSTALSSAAGTGTGPIGVLDGTPSPFMLCMLACLHLMQLIGVASTAMLCCA